jgi:hypothetical protein
VKPFTETNREFEDAIVGSQDDHVARRVQNGRADLAEIEMLLHSLTRLVGKRSIQVFRNVVPNVFAIYDHGSQLLFDVRFTVLN